MGRGLGHGVHVVATATRSLDVRAALKDQMLGRLELRLGDAMDSEFDRKVAAQVPAEVPGRGQVPEKLHFITALPRIDGVRDTADLAVGTARLVASVREAWSGPTAPPVRLLPLMLPADRLPKGFELPDQGIAIGVAEHDLQPVFVDFDTDPFLVVFGENESGKTTCSRLIIRQIAGRWTPDEATIVLADYRRTLLGSVPQPHLLEYAPLAPALRGHMDALSGVFARRQPPDDITPQQLRKGDWWSGPRIFVIVDDYELVATGSASPTGPAHRVAAVRPGHRGPFRHRQELRGCFQVTV